MARICEGLDCGKRIVTGENGGGNFTDPRGEEHDFCRTCWEHEVSCAACITGLRRLDPRVAAIFLADDRLVFVHRRCIEVAAIAYIGLIAAGAASAVLPPETKKFALNGTS